MAWHHIMHNIAGATSYHYMQSRSILNHITMRRFKVSRHAMRVSRHPRLARHSQDQIRSRIGSCQPPSTSDARLLSGPGPPEVQRRRRAQAGRQALPAAACNGGVMDRTGRAGGGEGAFLFRSGTGAVLHPTLPPPAAPPPTLPHPSPLPAKRVPRHACPAPLRRARGERAWTQRGRARQPRAARKGAGPSPVRARRGRVEI